MKFQDGACGDSDRCNSNTLTKSGVSKQADRTQKHSEGTAHGLGLSPSKKRERHTNNLKFARGRSQRERQDELRILHRNAIPGIAMVAREKTKDAGTPPRLRHNDRRRRAKLRPRPLPRLIVFDLRRLVSCWALRALALQWCSRFRN